MVSSGGDLPQPSQSPELGTPACPSFASKSNQKSSGGLGKGEQAATFSLFSLDVPRQLLSPKWPRLELGRPNSAQATALRSPRSDGWPGCLNFAPGGLAREGASHPAQLPRTALTRWQPASPQCCLAPGAGSLPQEAFYLHGGNREFRGNSLLLQGAQWYCATWAFTRRIPFICQVSCCP